ncbi:MAG TPA: hypothetical protein VK778_00600 [Solirubrobacteraceae bacterium]|jgi:hypothetical protein|nr:hypothetical protein [Solirubrobacteraceae bacterium]
MSTDSSFARILTAIITRIGLSVGIAALAAFSLATPAWAWSSGPPVYTLQISEGETTLPEEPIVSTSGSVSTGGSVQVSIVRGGVVVARESGSGGGTWMSQVPEVGDTVNLEAPVGTIVGSVQYDGLPSMDPTVCAGSTNFSGDNSLGETVKGHAVALSLKIEKYRTTKQESSYQRAQVTILSGTTFGGSFLAPLALGQSVTAAESLETPLAGGAVFDYISENTRPVGPCPPVVPPPAPPPPPPLQGSVLALSHLTILSLLKSGWHDHVTINQPGTVTQDLYLEGGTLPAFAAKSKHHKKPPPALLIARGAVVASSAGTVTVVLKLTAKGRLKLKSAKSLKLVLITTLRTSSGAKVNLARRTVSLHR